LGDIVKRLILTVLLALSSIVGATPTNNPVVSPTSWHGYGVDWYYGSLRIGVAYKDSLLDNGWALIETIITDSTSTRTLNVDSLVSFSEYALQTEVAIEITNARPIEMLWVGEITCADFADSSATEEIAVIDSFPAKYRIIEAIIDVTEAWDDGAGAISDCDISLGVTGSDASILSLANCYSAPIIVGDVSGEVAYTAVQNGYRLSWSDPTDIIVNLEATGGDVVDLVTGIARIYITYEAID
jgi:hypothetical protein